MLIAHRIALDPNNAQATCFARAAGTARFVWNGALAECKRQYAECKEDQSLPKPTEVSLRRQLNGIRREKFPWMYDVTKCAVQEAIIDPGTGCRAFFEGRANYPGCKAKGGRGGFCAANRAGTFRVDGKRIKLPVADWIRRREEVRFSGRLKRVTVSREADRWFASIRIATDAPEPAKPTLAQVGVDLGVKTLATVSRGKPIRGPKADTASLKRHKRTSRSLSHKKKGSANRRKATAALANLHQRVATIRKDATPKATTRLAKEGCVVCIENLNLKGMAKNRTLSRSSMDAGFFEFRRQRIYKTAMYGTRLVLADPWFASSKRCSCCGSVKTELTLSQRIFRCDECGLEADRDKNAAMNLEQYPDSGRKFCGFNLWKGTLWHTAQVGCETILEEAGT